MENETIELQNTQENTDIVFQDGNIDTENPENVENPQVTELAQALYSEIKNQAQNDSENIEDTETETDEVEQVEQVDYSEQISDIYDRISDLQSGIDTNTQSIASIGYSVETLPNDIRASFDDIVQFQYVTLSLYVGILIAIIFFKGLKNE